MEDDSLVYDENGELRETGRLDEETGEMKRPWCPATRILDHIENVGAQWTGECTRGCPEQIAKACVDV